MPPIAFTAARPSGSQTLEVDYSDGSQARYSLMWLLDSCPDGFHPQTGERAFDLLSVPDAPQLRSAQVLADGRLEFKLETVRLVKGCQSGTVTSKMMRMPKQALDDRVRLGERVELFNRVMVGWAAKSSKMHQGLRLALLDEPQGRLLGQCPTESLWDRLRVGGLQGRLFATSRGTMDKVINWLTFYNHSRLHSKLQYVSSMTFEQRWIEDQQQDRKSTVCIPSAHTEANYYRHLARQASTVEVCIEPTTAHVEPTTAHGV